VAAKQVSEDHRWSNVIVDGQAGSQSSQVGLGGRDRFVDVLRAVSVIVVVAWHWVFTIPSWTPSGPDTSNPLAFTYGLWPLTWLGQVMPLFFFIGGVAHLSTWEKVRNNGGGYAVFVGSRFRRLVVPALPLLACCGAVYVAVRLMADPPWLLRTVVVVMSPLWFLAAYLMLVSIAPLMIRLHGVAPLTTLVLLGTSALGLDGLRFAQGQAWAAWANFVVVWAFCHQLGFFYPRLVRSRVETRWAMLLGGGVVLAGLVATDTYPASMVSVPGQKTSNVGPPTVAVVALVVFQVGLAMLVRAAVLRATERPTATALTGLVNRLAMPLYLFHGTAYALTIVVFAQVLDLGLAQSPTLIWWLERPLFVAGPLLSMVLVLWVFARPSLEYACCSLRALARGTCPERQAAGEIPPRQWLAGDDQGAARPRKGLPG